MFFRLETKMVKREKWLKRRRFRRVSEAGHAAPIAVERICSLSDARKPPPSTSLNRGSSRRRLHLPSRFCAATSFGPRFVLSLRTFAPQGPWSLQCLAAFRRDAVACSQCAAFAQGPRRAAEDERGVGFPGHPLPGFRRPTPRHPEPAPSIPEPSKQTSNPYNTTPSSPRTSPLWVALITTSSDHRVNEAKYFAPGGWRDCTCRA